MFIQLVLQHAPISLMCFFSPHSSLSSVDPPEVWFDLKLPQSLIKLGKLSSLQLEAVVYACQQHTNILPDGTRAGFLIGMCTSL